MSVWQWTKKKNGIKMEIEWGKFPWFIKFIKEPMPFEKSVASRLGPKFDTRINCKMDESVIGDGGLE